MTGFGAYKCRLEPPAKPIGSFDMNRPLAGS